MQEPSFFDKVYEVAKLIPFGRVTSYGAIAMYLGAARSARMVGWAMNNSHGKDVLSYHLHFQYKTFLFLEPARIFAT